MSNKKKEISLRIQKNDFFEGAKIGQYIKGKRLKVDFAKPKKFKDEPKSNNKRECYNCGGEGHLSKFCLKNNGLPSNSH